MGIELHWTQPLCPALKSRNDGLEYSMWYGQRILTARVILHGELELVPRLAFPTFLNG